MLNKLVAHRAFEVAHRAFEVAHRAFEVARGRIGGCKPVDEHEQQLTGKPAFLVSGAIANTNLVAPRGAPTHFYDLPLKRRVARRTFRVGAKGL